MYEQSTLLCSECSESTVEGDRVEWWNNDKVTRVQHRKCADNAAREEFKKTGKLSTSLMMSAQLNVRRADLHAHCVDDDIVAATRRLEIDVKRFEIEAWFGGVDSEVVKSKWDWEGFVLTYPRVEDSLQSIIEDSPHRTIAAKLDDIDVTGQEMAGRALVELENKVARITLITAAGEQGPRMGIQGVDGTETEFRRMIHAVRKGWRGLKFEAVK